MSAPTDALARHLNEIPALADEAWATWGTRPISGDRAGGKHRGVRLAGEMPDYTLADLDRIVALNGGNDHDGLGVLSTWTRALLDEMTAEDHTPHEFRTWFVSGRDGVRHHGPNSVASVSDWLTRALPWIDEHPYQTEGLHDDVQRLWAALRTICRVTDRKPWPCLTDGCQGLMQLADDGDYLTCDNGHTHAGLSRWRHHPSMPLPDAAEALNVPQRTLRFWVGRGEINRDDAKGIRPIHVWPWDVIGKRYPEWVYDLDPAGRAR